MTTTTIATDSEAQWPAQCWKQKDSGSHTNISINMTPTTSTFSIPRHDTADTDNYQPTEEKASQMRTPKMATREKK